MPEKASALLKYKNLKNILYYLKYVKSDMSVIFRCGASTRPAYSVDINIGDEWLYFSMKHWIS